MTDSTLPSLPVEDFPSGPVGAYDDVRDRLKTGDLMFCSGAAWGSRLIKWGTKSCWSHAAVILRLADIDRVMVLESVESAGVRAVPLSFYIKGGYDGSKPYPGGVAVARHEKFPDIGPDPKTENWLTFTQTAVDLFGRPYDAAEIRRITARIAANVVERLFFDDGGDEREPERDKAYICSEYVDECYRSIGIELNNNTEGFISPADIARDKNIGLVAVLKSA